MTVPIEDRLPPHAIESEEYVLGAILLDPAVLPAVAVRLQPGDLYRDAHQVAYRAILDLADRGAPVDPLSLHDELSRRGQADRVGGHEAIGAFRERVPHSVNAEYHAAVVAEKARLRELIAASEATLRDCYSGRLGSDAALERAEAAVLAIADRGRGDGVLHAGEAAAAALERIAARRDGECAGVSTGLDDLDDLCDGLTDGGLIVLAARPSIGKTALALNVAEHASAASGVATLFCSLEMSAAELGERLVVSGARVHGKLVRTGKHSDADQAALDRAYSRIAAARLWIDATPAASPSRIAALARRWRDRHDLGLLVVDYLQLVEAGEGAGRRASRQEQVAFVSRRLKALAMELSVPVLALAQLNRQSELRADKRPSLADLRESGAIEADADLVLLLHRPEFYNPGDRPGRAELIVAKNRNGATGAVDLAFLKHLARFENISHQECPLDDNTPEES
jgi:replicative DNA helicase